MTLIKSLTQIILFLFIVNFTFSQTEQTSNSKDSTSYATIYIYRLNIRESRNNTFRVYFGDTSFKVKNYTNHVIHVYNEGVFKIWVRNETYDEINLNIKFGNEYYIRCDLNPGFFAIRPKLFLVKSQFGKADCESIPDLIKRD